VKLAKFISLSGLGVMYLDELVFEGIESNLEEFHLNQVINSF